MCVCVCVCVCGTIERMIYRKVRTETLLKFYKVNAVPLTVWIKMMDSD